MGKIKWVKLRDWSALPRTTVNYFGDNWIGEDDIKNFLDHLISESAKKLDMPVEEFREIFEDKNYKFYWRFDYIYHTVRCMSFECQIFVKLRKYLRVPKVIVKK